MKSVSLEDAEAPSPQLAALICFKGPYGLGETLDEDPPYKGGLPPTIEAYQRAVLVISLIKRHFIDGLFFVLISI